MQGARNRITKLGFFKGCEAEANGVGKVVDIVVGTGVGDKAVANMDGAKEVEWGNVVKGVFVLVLDEKCKC